MTFTSEYADDLSRFTVGDITRAVELTEADYHAVAQLLNEAYKIGREASMRDLLESALAATEPK